MLLLSVVALATGLLVAARPGAPKSDLTLWTFSAEHAAIDREALASFGTQTRTRIAVETLADRAENLRLQSIFLDPPAERSTVPNLVEIEIGQIGRFFRPPVDEIGLLPLNEFLKRDRLSDAFDAARLATWSKDGVVVGLPLDLHPVALAYRSDPFRQAGVDLETARTWPEFQQACETYQTFWQHHGQPQRWAMELSRSTADNLSMMLLQRHVDLIDRDGHPTINADLTVQTLMFYAQLIAGRDRIGLDPGSPTAQARDITQGNVAIFWMPDWRLAEFKSRFPELAGKMKLIPLPRFEPSDAPTSSWGGTMLGIPRSTNNPELAWRAAKHLLFDPSAVALRMQDGVLPAVPAQRRTVSGEDDPYFSGQNVHVFYADLAQQMPSPRIDPQTVIARAELSVALSAVVTQLERGDGEPIENVCRRWLDWAAGDLSARLAQGRLAS